MTAVEIIEAVARRVGLVIGKPEYLASPTGDYWAVKTSAGEWLCFSADDFEAERDSDVEARLLATLASNTKRQSP